MKKFVVALTVLLFASCSVNVNITNEYLPDAGEMFEHREVSGQDEINIEQTKEWDITKGRAAQPQYCFEIFETGGFPPNGNPQTVDLGWVNRGEMIEKRIRFYNFCIDPEVIFLGITWPEGPDANEKNFPFRIISQPKYGEYYPPRGPDVVIIIQFTPQRKGTLKTTMRVHFVMGYTDFIFLAKTP